MDPKSNEHRLRNDLLRTYKQKTRGNGEKRGDFYTMRPFKNIHAKATPKTH